MFEKRVRSAAARLRIDSNGSPSVDYRIENGRVERRPAGTAAQEGAPVEEQWEALAPEQLAHVVATKPVVANWLFRRLGVRALVRACSQRSYSVSDEVLEGRHAAQEGGVGQNPSSMKGRHTVIYTGTLVKDLQSIVDACLQSDARICAICQQRYGDHSKDGARCPVPALAGRVYAQTTFKEKRCESNVA